LTRESRIRSDHLEVEAVCGARRTPQVFSLQVPGGSFVVMANELGALVVSQVHGPQIPLVGPRSVYLAHGPSDLCVQVARGVHVLYVIQWRQADTKALYRWAVDQACGGFEEPFATVISAQPFSAIGAVFDRVVASCQGSHPSHEPKLFGALHELVGLALTSPSEFRLTYIPDNLPDSLDHLVRGVRERPSAPWGLQEAAQYAGYSTYHLSRTFRLHLGMGFPEYVDRCRTEVAVGILLSGNFAIEDIASACGFGSSQGLRDSFREYLGLLPSELRPSASTEPQDQAHRGRYIPA
jgi:AraC-like DNA-binding protein